MKFSVTKAFVAVGIAISLTSCQKENPVTAPENSSIGQTPELIKLPRRADGLRKKVTASEFIEANRGGEVKLKDKYIAADGRLIEYDIKLKFDKDALPEDADITMTMEDSVLISSVDLTFYPHGITFNKLAKLDVKVKGLDLGTEDIDLKLYYVENGTWIEMPESDAKYKHDHKVEGKGKLPHFSRYAFGR